MWREKSSLTKAANIMGLPEDALGVKRLNLALWAWPGYVHLGMVHLNKKRKQKKEVFEFFSPGELNTVLSDFVPQVFLQPQGGAHGKGGLIWATTTLRGITKVFRKEFGSDIQLMDFAVVMHTEVSGTLSDLLQQGDKILPRGL